MAIQIERNENGNCVNFRGATQPVYWNNCLTAVAVGTDRINIENDIRSAGVGQTYYEYFNVKIEDFCDNNGASFANATAAANYINGVAKATPSGGIGPNDNINTTGIITASQFSGDGSGLTGITAAGSGVVIQEEGSNVGTAATLNFVGDTVTATISGGVATIGITGGGGGITTANINADTLNVSGVSTFQSNVHLGDDDKLIFGDDQDLEIFHNSGNNNTVIQENTNGNFVIKGTNLFLQSRNSEDFFKGEADGAVTLFYDDTEKFKTTGYGVTVTGIVSATSYYGDGSNLTGITTSQIIGYSAGGGGGSGIGTQLADNVTLNFGDSDDLQISHNGTASFIKDVGTGSLIIQGSNIRLQNGQSSGTALQITDGSAQLHNNNSKKLETTPDGVSITGIATVSSKVHVGGGTTFTEDLVVTGDARVPGILSIGTGTIVLDPSKDEILVGDVKLKRSSTGTIEIRSKDDALKDIKVKKIVSSGMSEDEDGNLSIVGVVTATKFVKPLGTSSQFLKADGSVDSTSYSTFDGNYNNLTNRPTIPTNNNQLTNGAGFITTSFVNTSQLNNDAKFITTSFTNTNQLTNGAGFITGVSTFSGNYNDLSNKPTIPTNNNQLTNGAGFITTSFTNTNQLVNGAGFITTSFTSYNQLSDTPTIPTNNNQLTNGAGFITTSFTNTNQLVNGAGFITTSFTNTNQLTNGAGFITSSGTAALSQGLTGTPNITVGDIVANNVSIAQTLTYEDVTNVDSVGLVTARTGIKVLSGGINAVGVVTATSLVKSGGTSSQFLKADGSVDSTSYSTFSGDYDDLSNKPTIPTNNNQLTNGAGYITTSFTNTNQLTNGAGFITTSFTNTNQLTNGAGFITGVSTFSGNYNDLSNKPTIPTNNNQLTNGAGYITATLTNEQVQDIVGAMLSGNTESGITVTYQDDDGTIDFSVTSQTDNNFTTTLKNKLDGIEASADVTDATNVDAAGAVMESDTTTANMSFVIDEDNMASDSNTKVPTQQSVKAYVDANSGGGGGGGGGVTTGKSIAMAMVFG